MNEFTKNKKHLAVLIIAFLLAVASWVIAIYYWGKLPQIIPTHFGITGQPDSWSNKSFWSVFFVPLLQSVMFALFVFLYWKPQFSDMPTTLWLTTMDKETKDHAFGLIRTMLVVVSLWINVLFTYITYSIIASAQMKQLGLNPWIMFGILGILIVWLTYYTVKVYKVTKEAIKKK